MFPRTRLFLCLASFLLCESLVSCGRERGTDTGSESTVATWEVETGDSTFYDAANVFQTPDQGFLICGVTYATGPSGIYVLKLDSLGNRTSLVTVGGQGSDWLSDADLRGDGNYVLAGVDRRASGGRIYTILVNGFGEVLLDTAIGPNGAGARALEATLDGGILFAALSQFAMLLLKTDYDLAIEWERRPESGMNAQANEVVNALDGGYMVVGEQGAFGQGNVDAFVLRIDHAGSTLWWQHIDISQFDGATDVVSISDGSFVVCGGSVGNAFLALLDPSGRIVQVRSYGGNHGAVFDNLVLLPDGDILASGSTQAAVPGAVKAWIMKFGPDLKVRWEATFGMNNVYSPVTAIPTTDGGFLVVGTSAVPYRGNLYIAKTDERGRIRK